MKKITLILTSIIAIGAITAAGWYFYNANKYTPDTYMVTPGTDSSVTSTSTISKDQNGNKIVTKGATSFTTSDVSQHNDASGCYSIISGTVYDLTMWVNLHPGGKGTILSICGVDGTDKFMKQHRGGAKFMTILGRYQIGVLTK